ncbi:MAG TPA: thioesterase family protein [Alphaproteobacteria bacterium]|nr:thioesterase family protein [Alphaproteobacteria bacterium]
MTEVAGADRRDRGLYPVWVRETIRYADTDRQGHVNNAVFATLCETGRALFLHGSAAPTLPSDRAFVIARLELDFLAEMNWPGEAEIGTAVARVGRSSFRLVHAIWKDGVCAATAETVIVLMNETTRGSAPLPDDLRSYLLDHALKA